jgi:hypothetical protein
MHDEIADCWWEGILDQQLSPYNIHDSVNLVEENTTQTTKMNWCQNERNCEQRIERFKENAVTYFLTELPFVQTGCKIVKWMILGLGNYQESEWLQKHQIQNSQEKNASFPRTIMNMYELCWSFYDINMRLSLCSVTKIRKAGISWKCFWSHYMICWQYVESVYCNACRFVDSVCVEHHSDDMDHCHFSRTFHKHDNYIPSLFTNVRGRDSKLFKTVSFLWTKSKQM